MAIKKRGLGKGLSALLEDAKTDITSGKGMIESDKTLGSVSLIPIQNIEVNPFQPRTEFEKDALVELASSIKEHGIIQPITVRKLGYDKYQLISGERRFRASQAAGLTELPAYIRVANDQTMLELALVENIQRRDLDPIEVAISYKRLIDECHITQEELGKKVSKSRAAVTNSLRLLKLPVEIQLALRGKQISMGHARALLGLESEKQQLSVLKKIIAEKWSVRQVEEFVRGKEDSKTKSTSKKVSLSFEDQKLQDDLRSIFKSKVVLKRDITGKGKIEIPFGSATDLNDIIDYLNL